MAVYYPDVRGDVNEMLSDVLAQGAALGKWNSTIIIFVLKNWCAWTDRRESDDASGADQLDIKVKTVAELFLVH